MNNFAIMRFNKLKFNDRTKKISTFNTKQTEIFRRLKHNLRCDNSLNHVDKSKKNHVIVGSDNLNDIAFSIDKYVNENVKTIKKDNVVALEFVLTASNFERINIKKWVDENIKFLTNKFEKRENIVSAVLHLDETTPHLHVVVLPIFGSKFNAKKVTAGKKMCSEMQDEYAEHMQKFELRRGIKQLTSKDKKRSDYKFIRKVKRLKNKLIDDLNVQKEALDVLKDLNFEYLIEDKKTFESSRTYKKRMNDKIKNEIIKIVDETCKNLIDENVILREENDELYNLNEDLNEEIYELKQKDDKKSLIKQMSDENIKLTNENEALKEELNLYKQLDKEEIKILRSVDKQFLFNSLNMNEDERCKYKSKSTFDIVKFKMNCDMNSAILFLRDKNEEFNELQKVRTLHNFNYKL